MLFHVISTVALQCWGVFWMPVYYKALVNHGVLFCKLFDRGLPLCVLRFLSSWYETQKMSVRWSHSFSDPFSVFNGVRQGS